MTADEQTDWLSGSAAKGSYNYTDLNRVESAVQYLAEQLEAYGYAVAISPTRTWAVGDVPTFTDMVRYLTNIRLIREAFVTFGTTPSAPVSMQRLTYSGANDIEQILKDVDMLVNNMISTFTHSGEIYGGEI